MLKTRMQFLALGLLLSSIFISPNLIAQTAESDTLASPDRKIQGLNAYHETDSLSSLFERLIDKERFEEVIAIGQGSSVMDAKGFYYYGLAHFYLDQDALALAQLEKSMELDPIAPGPRYYKAIILMLRENFTEAKAVTRVGLKHRESSGDLVVLMGRLHSLSGRLDSAQFYWENALSLDVFPSTVFNDLGNLYYDQKLLVKAREMYEQALVKLERGSFTWLESAYNLGVIDYKRGDFERAEAQYLEILELAPDDFEAVEKLVQCKYARQKYDEAEPYKLIMYRARSSKQLPDYLNEEFRLDEFEFEGLKIFAHERFATPLEGEFKHIFYVTSPDGKVLRTIQTEVNKDIIQRSPALRNLDRAAEFRYVISEVSRDVKEPGTGGKNSNKASSDGEFKHYYLELLFEAEPNYPALKAAIIRVLEGELEAIQLTVSNAEKSNSKKKKKRRK